MVIQENMLDSCENSTLLSHPKYNPNQEFTLIAAYVVEPDERIVDLKVMPRLFEC